MSGFDELPAFSVYVGGVGVGIVGTRVADFVTSPGPYTEVAIAAVGLLLVIWSMVRVYRWDGDVIEDEAEGAV